MNQLGGSGKRRKTRSRTKAFQQQLRDQSVSVKVATWNLLADGLSFGEFLSDEGDRKVCDISVRLGKIVDTLSDLFKNGVDIVGTQENDHPEWILDGLRQSIPSIELIKLKKTDGPSNSFKFLTSRNMGRFDLGKFNIQNDTISIYYNASNNLSTCDEGNSFLIDGKKTYGAEACFVKNGKTFHIFNAHLSSGEDVAKATQRVKEVKDIIKHAQTVKNPIILMDSNSSDLYPLDKEVQLRNGLIPGSKYDKKKEKNVEDWKHLQQGNKEDILIGDAVLDQFEKAGFTDILDGTPNECFKMRHGSGGQPSKFGTLMFDRIDKIVIPNRLSNPNIRGKPVPLSNFTNQFLQYYDKLTDKQIQRVIDIRNNVDDMRDALEKKVKDERWSDIVGMQRGQPIGFDSKGVPNHWDPEYQSLEDNTILPQDIQMALYPNIDAPSDHPPCIAEIQLQ